MERSIRKIIHIDMDAFFASVEQRDNPGLRGKPVAVGGSERRGVVATASYEARRFGIHSAMPSLTAKRRCPQLIFVRPRFQAYRTVSLQIREIFSEYTDLIEPLSLDEAFLDVTKNKKCMQSATIIARELKQRILRETQLTASAGVSMNKFLAKIASDYQKPDGLTVITPDQALMFIDQLPIEKFFGIGKVTAEKMHKLEIYTGEDLRKWSREQLHRHFGKSGGYYFEVAQNRDNRPVTPHRKRKSLGAERTFRSDMITPTEIRVALTGIAEEVFRRVERAKIMGKTITVKIKFSDFRQITRRTTIHSPVDTFLLLQNISQRLLEKANVVNQPIRLLGISVSNFQHSEEVTEKQLELTF
jgi:DNA polymerase-4